jgi:hypothetical protein
METKTMTRLGRLGALAAVALALSPPSLALAQAPPATPPAATLRDGSHDFDFLIGRWKAHVRRLPERLVGSTAWIEYDGISDHRKILASNANLEEFEVDSPASHLHIHAQTLRLYNPETHQWSIYLLDLEKGELSLPPVVGHFTNGRGEFYDQETWKGRAVFIRYQWSAPTPTTALMQQAFSADGGKTWEVNWICELTRDGS